MVSICMEVRTEAGGGVTVSRSEDQSIFERQFDIFAKNRYSFRHKRRDRSSMIEME